MGDIVYIVENNTDACNMCDHFSSFYGMDSICDAIEDSDKRNYPRFAEYPICKKQFLEIVKYRAQLGWVLNHINDFGKTVFLTREEAEAKLKELEGSEYK